MRTFLMFICIVLICVSCSNNKTVISGKVIRDNNVYIKKPRFQLILANPTNQIIYAPVKLNVKGEFNVEVKETGKYYVFIYLDSCVSDGKKVSLKGDNELILVNINSNTNIWLGEFYLTK